MADVCCCDCAGSKRGRHAIAGDDGVDRYHLSVIALIIERSPGSMAAAHKLWTDGFLKSPKAMS